MKLFILADEKPDQPLKELSKDCDVILLLGDLFPSWVEELKDVDLPILGVHGNHDYDKVHNPDQIDIFKMLGGIDLHLKTFEHQGVTFTGFDGDMGYVFAENDAAYPKPIDRIKMKAELEKLNTHPPADVLVTHYPSVGTLDMPFLGHKGLGGFRSYIERVQPSYHFHGHVHKQAQAQIGSTNVFSVFPYLKLEI